MAERQTFLEASGVERRRLVLGPARAQGAITAAYRDAIWLIYQVAVSLRARRPGAPRILTLQGDASPEATWRLDLAEDQDLRQKVFKLIIPRVPG